jgi:hypothetical protein
MGMPRKMLAKATAEQQRRGEGAHEVAGVPHLAPGLGVHLGAELEGHPRRISAKSSRNSAAYMPENSTAYAPGKAAKVTPPAVISHTSLPSQKGPAAL